MKLVFLSTFSLGLRCFTIMSLTVKQEEIKTDEKIFSKNIELRIFCFIVTVTAAGQHVSNQKQKTSKSSFPKI